MHAYYAYYAKYQANFIISTHDIHDIGDVADRIFYMHEGELVFLTDLDGDVDKKMEFLKNKLITN